MANPTTNFGWVMPASTDLVTDLPADFAVFGQAVDTSLAELKGGTTGQFLTKTSNTDMDFTWAGASAPAFVGCIAYGAVNLAYSSTPTAITMTSEVLDTDAFHSTSTNTSRFTIPSGKDGKYLLTVDANLASVAGLQNIYLRLYKNGSQYTTGLTSGNLQTIVQGLPQDAHFNASIIVDSVATDYWEFFILSGSGAPTVDKCRVGLQFLGA